MSTSAYIRFPIETNPTTLAQSVYSYIKARAPQWIENDAELDTWIIQALTTLAADLRTLASDVPDDIFRWFGATMMALPPIDDAMSTVFSTWTMNDNAGYTIPAGTEVAIRDSAGNLIPFETLLDIVIPAGSVATAAGAVQLRSIDPGANTAGLGGIGVAAQLLDTLAFVSTIILTGVTAGGLDAEDDTTYLNRLATQLRLLSRRPILPADFAIMARSVTGVYRSVAIDGYNPFHNLLSVNQSSLETDTSGWAVGVNCTLTRDLTQFSDGIASLRMRSVAAGDMTAETTPTTQTVITPGSQITARAEFKAAVSPRSVGIFIVWRDAAGAFISVSASGFPVDATAAWTVASVTATAPTNAFRATVRVQVSATGAANEDHFVDKISIRRGGANDWVLGGTAETGNPRTITVAAIDINGADVSGPVQTAIQALLSANREVNFLTYVVGARRTSIDVSFTAKAAAGYIASDVQARAIAAVQAYLSASVWGNSSNDPQDWTEQTVVRYSEVAQVISNVEGLDYWTALTIGYTGGALAAADINIASPAALATAGVITGVVT